MSPMSTKQHQAIIIKVIDWSAKDRIVTLLTADCGKLRAINYGAKSRSNRHNGSLQLFNTVEIELDYMRQLPAIKQSDCIVSRRALRDEFDKLQYSAFVVELIDALYHEHDNDAELFKILSTCLSLLTNRNARISALIAAIHLIGHAGYKPYLDICSRCGKKIVDHLHFDFSHGGSLCHACSPAQLAAQEINAAVVLLAQLQTLSLDLIQDFSVNSSNLIVAEKIFYPYITHHINHKFK